jgi:pyridoxamine 5'-phosphate oxidase
VLSSKCILVAFVSHRLFDLWFTQPVATDLAEPNAMSLATVDGNGQPWQRRVLLKLFDKQGFVFFTNYSSRKVEHTANNNRVSLLFPWQALGRQVKVTGHSDKISTAESLKYFLARPRGSQIGAWASPQSKVIGSRAMLESKVDEIKQRFKDGDMSLPEFWGGYRITADTFEFWQARESRLHDRFIYMPDVSGTWGIRRLAP